MNNYTVSVDAGNGHVSAILDSGKRPKFARFPSARFEIKNRKSFGQGGELQIERVGWNDIFYAVGDDALSVTREEPERHIGGPNRYGRDLHQHLVATAIARLGIKEGQVDLILYLPPKYYDVKDRVQLAFMAQPVVTITLDGTEHTFEYTSVTILPEGLSAVGCFAADATGKPINADDVLGGRVWMIDLGCFTTDVWEFINGQHNIETVTTMENLGTHRLLREPLAERLDARPEDIDAMLMNSSNGTYVLDTGSGARDVTPEVRQRLELYVDTIRRDVFDNMLREFKDTHHAILTGGGAHLMPAYLRDVYGPLLDISKHVKPKSIQPADMNSIGGLRLYKMQMGATA